MKKKKFPILKCFPTSHGQVKAWCPFCEKWHIHGYTGKITKAIKIGHWAAHCHNPKSPFRDGGYELKLMSRAEIKAIAESIKLYGKQVKD